PDFTSAANDLMTFGVCGPVIFNVRNGTYNEQISIGNVTGSSPANYILFQSESGDSTQVTLSFFSGSSNNYIIKLLDCNDLTFRKMTLQALSPSYGKVVVGSGNLRRVNFKNNIVLGSTSNPSVAYDHILFNLTFSQQSVDFYIDRSILKYGGIAVETSGPAAAYTDTTIFITNNTLTDQYLRGVEFSSQAYTYIRKNTITTNTTFDNYQAVVSYIDNRNAYIGYNTIYGFAGTGISLRGISGCKVHNNSISIRENPQSVYVYSAVFAETTTQSSFYNNSLAAWGSRWGGSAITIGGYDGPAYTDTLKNNSFAFMGGGGYAVYFNYQSMNLQNVMDHNDFHTCGDTMIYSYYNFGNTAYANLAAWQAATGRDMNSVEAPPQFVSMNDLHITSNTFLDNRGVYIAQTATDIDGQARSSTTPDIGADEFSSLANDAAAVELDATTVVCSGGNVSAVIGNFGTNALTSVQVHWSVNAVQQPFYFWNGNLAPATLSPSLVLGTYVLTPTDVITAWTELPNGVADSYPQADTSRCNAIIAVPVPDLGPDTSFCDGVLVNLVPGNFTTYQWSDGSTGNHLIVG
ncbi:MAG TPA: right-handed parallel beta-helix repeat-containing protein, partial [Bacteroidia bacterium]|nr:right-handed parallel beta-helix repeat-containing protein [Bacteroidia bacterium]